LKLVPHPDFEAFTRHFRETFGPALIAVIAYGSCRSDATRRASSIYDFFLICDDYRAFHGKGRDAFLNRIVPPNIYYLELPAADPKSPPLACKYNVMSLAHVLSETSAAARDIYLIGRLGKRVGITYSRDPEIEGELVRCAAEAMRRNVRLVLPTAPREGSLDALICQLLAQSYEGEFRVERSTKVAELFEADKAHYRAVYRTFFEEAGEVEWRDEAHYRTLLPEAVRLARARETATFLRRSQRRSILRWAKNTLTFHNYVDYVVRKVERTAGIRLELTMRERKYPLLLGWRHLIRLYRQGLLK
jgi:hypothetical protein